MAGANDFEIQKTYLQLFKKIKDLEKDQSAPDWVGDPRAWRIGAEWGLRLAMNWIENNTLVPLPAEIDLLKSKLEVKGEKFKTFGQLEIFGSKLS